MNSRDGFTLPELLIAVALCAVVSTSLYFHFNIGLHVYGRVNRDLGVLTKYQLCFSKLEEELSNLVLLEDVDVLFSKRKISFPSVTAFYKDGEGITRIALVSYYYQNNALYRSVEPVKHDDTKTFKKRRDVVMRDVVDVSFAYAFVTPDKDIEWREAWDDAITEEDSGSNVVLSVPRGIRLQVTSKKATKKNETRFDQRRLAGTIVKTLYVPVGTLREVKLGL